MGSCEICGSSNVATKRASSNGRDVLACERCMKAAGLKPNITGVSRYQIQVMSEALEDMEAWGVQARTSWLEMKKNYSDFGQRVIDARRKKGIEQRDLARAISERINVIQRVERGQHPGDSVIKKLERFLNVELL